MGNSLWRSFTLWLAVQEDRDDPVGDLAKDWADDSARAQVRSFRAMERHLAEAGACADAMAAYARAVREWKADLEYEMRHWRGPALQP